MQSAVDMPGQSAAGGWRPGGPLTALLGGANGCPFRPRRDNDPAPHMRGYLIRPAEHVDERHRCCALIATVPADAHAYGVLGRSTLPLWHESARRGCVRSAADGPGRPVAAGRRLAAPLTALGGEWAPLMAPATNVAGGHPPQIAHS